MSIVTRFWRWLVNLVRRRRFIGQFGGTVTPPPPPPPPPGGLTVPQILLALLEL